MASVELPEKWNFSFMRNPHYSTPSSVSKFQHSFSIRTIEFTSSVCDTMENTVMTTDQQDPRL